MRRDFKGYQPSRNASPIKCAQGYTVMNAGECRALQCPDSYALALEPKPTKKYPAHAGMYVFHNGDVVKGEYLDRGYQELLKMIVNISSYHPF
ncbi:MAG: hypothetical protein LUD17_15920 [Bacteroidales bacterium]|nr:hypothetical protein [Bacteroidales bacterium]